MTSSDTPKPKRRAGPLIPPVDATPARVAWADYLATHACFEAQMHGGRGPFVIKRVGRRLECVRFFTTQGGAHIYAASYKGKKAWPLTEAETRDLAAFMGVAPPP